MNIVLGANHRHKHPFLPKDDSGIGVSGIRIATVSLLTSNHKNALEGLISNIIFFTLVFFVTLTGYIISGYYNKWPRQLT